MVVEGLQHIAEYRWDWNMKGVLNNSNNTRTPSTSLFLVELYLIRAAVHFTKDSYSRQNVLGISRRGSCML